MDKKYWTEKEIVEPIEKAYYMFIYKNNQKISMFEFYKYDDIYKSYSETAAFSSLEERDKILPPFHKTVHARTMSHTNSRSAQIYTIPGMYTFRKFALKKGGHYMTVGTLNQTSRKILQKTGFGKIVHEHEYCGGKTKITFANNHNLSSQIHYNKIDYIEANMEDHT